MKFEYMSRHFPTGSVCKQSGEFESEADFLRHLNKWNVQGNGIYLYTAQGITPKGHAALDLGGEIISQERTPESIIKAGGWWTDIGKKE
jgi:hypothetical protein